MTFQDEFNGTKLDTTKWEAPEMPRQGSSRWVKSLVRVEKGLLHLGVKLTNDPVLRYDCAGIRTRKNYDINQTLFQQRYGYFETRCKLPKNLKADYWGSFGMMCGNVGDQTPDTRNGVEVAFHSTNKNVYRTTKALIYAQSGIPEYWVLDVNTRELHVHTTPTQNGYQSIVTLPDTATVTVKNNSVAVADLLP
jgi:Putative restriction endonuclease